MLDRGAENTDFQVVEPKTEDIYMLSFTSGTTGDPKGVKLSHYMMMNVVTACQHNYCHCKLDNKDVYISYLPYAHIVEQFFYAISIVDGLQIGYYSGDVHKMLTEDLPVLKPTLFPSVPRIWNRFYSII